jgi:hypothetical protein
MCMCMGIALPCILYVRPLLGANRQMQPLAWSGNTAFCGDITRYLLTVQPPRVIKVNRSTLGSHNWPTLGLWL